MPANAGSFVDPAIAVLTDRAERIERAIVDSGVEIGPEAVVGADQGDDQRITLIGQRARIAAHARIAAGERVPPKDRA